MTNQLQRNLLLECCRHALDTTEIQSILSEVNKQTDQSKEVFWNELNQLASAHGVYPHFKAAMQKVGQDLISVDLLGEMKQKALEIVMFNMRMAVELIRILKALEFHNMQALAFKGPTLSQFLYGDVVSRQYGDLDILIDKDSLEDSIQVLEEYGYRPYNDLTIGQLEAMQNISHDFALVNKDNKVLLELHWRLFSNEYFVNENKINYSSNFSFIEINGYPCRSLATEELLMYLAVHGAKHQWERLGWLLDVAVILQNKKIDWDRLLVMMRESSTEKILLTTFLLCQHYFGNHLPDRIVNEAKKNGIPQLTKKLQQQFEKDFHDPLKKAVNTKKISFVQYRLLPGARSKWLYLLSLFQPTELDYQSVNLSGKLTFIYYFIRPYNVVRRWLGNVARLKGKG
jgi:hypothetical protein